MAAQTKPVDVLAVMDSCTDELEKQPGCYYTDAAKLQEARAAIAELIEALRKAEDRLGVLIESDTEDHGGAAPEDVAAWEACNAAIARVGGGK